jgi:hypothetical protein
MGWIAPSCERCTENAPRLAQLEKVAELARPVVAQDAGPFAWTEACQLLALALIELDNHPDTRRDPREPG